MAVARRSARRPAAAPRGPEPHRFTVDASAFVNAFNPHEQGHGQSLSLLTVLQERGDPIIVPTLLLPEIAAAVARVTDDDDVALDYAQAAVRLPHLTVVTLTTAMARLAGELAATYRLRGADAVYVAVARRYGTTLVSRDDEQRTRGALVVGCQTPEEALDALSGKPNQTLGPKGTRRPG